MSAFIEKFIHKIRYSVKIQQLKYNLYYINNIYQIRTPELPFEKGIHGPLEYPLEIIDLLYFSSFHESPSTEHQF